jgi:DNA-binding response OmpR family regulator/anti-anti-sigma regulatory factor
MIVDDLPANLGVLIEHLEEHGYRVVIAEDSIEALQRAELVQPDLILLDVMMPGTDGFETCRLLKASERARDAPVIFTTSLADTPSKLKGFEAGGVDYITKPIDLDDLLARIKTHLALRAAQKQVEGKNAELEREIAMREQAEAALQLARCELEQRIAERTLDLVNANASLKAEIAERERAETALHDKLGIIEQQREQIRALTTPVIQVWDGVLMMAVLSAIDARAAAKMMDVLLHAVVRTRSRFTILDLTAVEVLDRETADHLVALVGAVQLLGAEGIVVGIRPEVARTLAEAGTDLRAIRTLANLRDALLVCMRSPRLRTGTGST